MTADLRNHPGLNPSYYSQMDARRIALREKRMGYPVYVPKQPNKYMPHIGAKQRAKGAARAA